MSTRDTGVTNDVSSLQRAVLAIADTSTNSAVVTKKGDFEACFAGGLDFSECASDPATVSHSARLLQIKQTKALQQWNNDQEEARFIEAVEKRVATSRLTPPDSTTARLDWTPDASQTHKSQIIGALVVGMHGIERNNEPRHKSKHRGPKVNAKGRHTPSAKSTPSAQKQPATKKNQRRKH